MKRPKFGTADAPLRSSYLPQLLSCPYSAVLKMEATDRDGNRAADTGSAVHMAARAFHTLARKDARLSIGVMREAVAKYPLADLKIAEQEFQWYAADPRNAEAEAEVVLVEKEITFTLPPSEEDETQAEIVVMGTVDQVRREASGLYVWDIKTGARLQGADMINDHALQLAAYLLGAEQLLGEPVRGAGVIRTKDYADRKPVFWRAPFSRKDARSMLDGVRRVVAAVRAGRAWGNPGEHCRWCPMQSPANCQGALRDEQMA